MKVVFITIHYLGPAGRIEQSGSFPLRGKHPEDIALDWWEKVSRGYQRELEMITADGEDITKKVLELRKERWNKLTLPF